MYAQHGTEGYVCEQWLECWCGMCSWKCEKLQQLVVTHTDAAICDGHALDMHLVGVMACKY